MVVDGGNGHDVFMLEMDDENDNTDESSKESN
jgi:hypothetical protein